MLCRELQQESSDSDEDEGSSQESASDNESLPAAADEEKKRKKERKQKQAFQVVEIDLGIGAHANVEKCVLLIIHTILVTSYIQYPFVTTQPLIVVCRLFKMKRNASEKEQKTIDASSHVQYSFGFFNNSL